MSKDFKFSRGNRALDNLTGASTNVKAYYIPIEYLKAWQNQPFQAYSAEKLNELAHSINEHGLLHYPVVWKKAEDEYIILSGHNRIHAMKQNGHHSVPCTIKENITEDEAELILLNSNLNQRLTLSYKEKIQAYSRQHQLQKKAKNVKYAQFNDDLRTVQRYVKMQLLLPEFIDMLDAKKLNLGVAYELAFLSSEDQTVILNYMLNYNVHFTLNKMKELRHAECINDDILKNLFFSKDQSKEEILIIKSIHNIAGKNLPIKISLEDLQKLIEFLVKENIIKE